MARVYSNRITEYTHENGGRVALLFLLFALAIYEVISAGFNTFAVICLSPLAIIFCYVAFRWRMSVFWALIVVNWFLMNRNFSYSFPVSLVDETLELILISIALIDIRKETYFGRAWNTMLLAIILWICLCFIEIFNNTCGLGINVNAWFTGFRLMALHLVWILLVFSLYITNPKALITYLRVWACLSLFSAFWTWKMINIGLTQSEQEWLYNSGYVTHILNGGTLIRYWSTFNDAATYGCNASASAVAFLIFGKIDQNINPKCHYWRFLSSYTHVYEYR